MRSPENLLPLVSDVQAVAMKVFCSPFAKVVTAGAVQPLTPTVVAVVSKPRPFLRTMVTVLLPFYFSPL